MAAPLHMYIHVHIPLFVFVQLNVNWPCEDCNGIDPRGFVIMITRLPTSPSHTSCMQPQL